MDERRRHPRSAVHLLVQHSEVPGGQFDVDYATDVSHGGLFLTTAKPMPEGATLHVQFSPSKDTRLVSAFCRVARVTKAGVGAEFIGLDAESRQILHTTVVTR